MSQPIFPAIKAEVIVIVHADDSIRVVSDWQAQAAGVDVAMVFSLAMLQMLVQAQKLGGDPALILDHLMRLAGAGPR